MEQVKLTSPHGSWWLAEVYADTLTEQNLTITDVGNLCKKIDIIKGFVISPCHDKDVKEETGEIKKAHYHMVLQCVGTPTLKQMQDVFILARGDLVHIPANDRFELCVSYYAQIRYTCHLDDPDKVLYNRDEVFFYGDCIRYRKYLYQGMVYTDSMFLQDFYKYISDIKTSREFWKNLPSQSEEFQHYACSKAYLCKTMLYELL